MPETLCFQVPADHTLETLEGWSRINRNTFSAVRAHIILIKRRGKQALIGPAVATVDMPAGSEYTISQKDVVSISRADEVQRTVQETVTDKITGEYSQKIGAEIGAAGPLPSAKATSETQFRAVGELTNAVQRTVSAKQTFSVQFSTELTRSMTVKTGTDATPAASRRLNLYFGLWPWRWDFHLYKVELIRLKYAKWMVWWDVRQTLDARLLEPRQPLFSLTLYKPQEEFSIKEGEHIPDVAEPDLATVSELTDALPNVDFPINPTLENLARVAFPVTGDERRQAASRRAAAGGGKKAAAKKAAPKKAAKKAAPKRSYGKKAPKKAAPKKAASRKVSAKRAAAKR